MANYTLVPSIKHYSNSQQVNCGIGRDSVEAWGRKKRSVSGPSDGSAKDATGKPMGDDMTLSREIVVLDLKEQDPSKQQSSDKQTAQDSSSATIPKAKSSSSSSNRHHHHHKHHNNQQQQQQEEAALLGDEIDNTRHCLSRQSIFVLFTSIGFFFVLYMCVVACFFARRDSKISPIKHQFH